MNIDFAAAGGTATAVAGAMILACITSQVDAICHIWSNALQMAQLG